MMTMIMRRFLLHVLLLLPSLIASQQVGEIKEELQEPTPFVTAAEDGPADTEYAITVAGRTFHVPWSQYNDVADILYQRHGHTNWEYGDWLVALATSMRADPDNIDFIVNILESAVQTFAEVQEAGLGDASVSIGNAYMLMAGTYIYDSSNPQYARAIRCFTISNQHFKIALDDESKIPPGMPRTDLELNWANALVHIASLSVQEETGIAAPQKILSDITTRAEALLVDAIAVFQRQVALFSTADATKTVQLSVLLANALHNLASISMLDNTTIEKCNALLEEAVMHYQRAVELGSGVERDSAITGAAETLYSLAGVNLLEGKYDLAKARYRDSMEWYEEYSIVQPTISAVQDASVQANLEAAVQGLNECEQATLNGNQAADKVHEANLHARLGGFLLENNPSVAVQHLTSAIEVYARTDPANERDHADTQLHLARAHFKHGEYALSTKAHAAALDIYQELESKKSLKKEEMAEVEKDPVADLEKIVPPQKSDDAEEATKGDSTTEKGDTAKGDSNEKGVDNPRIDLPVYKASMLKNAATAANDDEL